MKKHGLTIGMIMIGMILFIGLFIGFYYYLNYMYIPSTLLLDGYDHQASIGPNHHYVVNYPRCDDYGCAIEYQHVAQLVLDEYSDTELTNVSLVMDIESLTDSISIINIHDALTNRDTIRFYDSTNDQLDATIEFSDDFLRMLRQDFLQLARSDARYQAVSYTSSFADGLNTDSLIQTVHYQAPMMVFSADLGYGQLTLEKDMRYFNDALPFDLANESIDRTIRYASIRTIDPTKKPIVLMIMPVMNRSNDDQWMSLLDHYGLGATVFSYGYTMEGNEDLIISWLNHNIEIGSLGMYGKTTDLNDIQADDEIYGPLRKIESISDHEATITTAYDPTNTLDPTTYPLDLIQNVDLITTTDALSQWFDQDISSIFLLVDNDRSLIESLAAMIPSLMDQGYQFISFHEYISLYH